ncbi:LytS/YhcK type 5TM receptor domain-containing protein [Siminovitchia fortis]|uniref:Sensor histidine kinase n=2 Tax=Siminovitchia fortis TaxID=254758 RepID=A0A443IQK8_9BACI|nr:LytS/YhcK type 5TM receptor domain-containing protein [Siminovitchia fortis]RWR08444.1 sensor histidine kinase [Siminovitchia fortis]WHY83080.1 LytS/YhcK type 5TM receptor domain-containing protein [Siminovitchia fortis]
MEFMTYILVQRLGLLLILAFLMTRIPSFRSLLDREMDTRTVILHAVIYGLFGIAGTISGIVIENGNIVSQFILFPVQDHQLVVSSSLVAIVIAGLLGGPVVGMGAGLIGGIHLFYLGGLGNTAGCIVNILTGLLVGMTARFFSNDRVISPLKALFIGIFPPILQMGILLIFHPHDDFIKEAVDQISLPLVFSNSVAIAIFTAMIAAAINEQEREAALETRRALMIAEDALPHLKKESQFEMAQGIAELLFKRLKVAAVSVSNREQVLAYVGLGADHHKPGDPLQTRLSHEVIQTGALKVAYSQDQIYCKHEKCPLQAAIIVPILESNETSKLIKLYFRKSQHIRSVEIVLAQGLGKLLTNQLAVVQSEKLQTLIRDAELRNLEAQINPHFLFNTLHLIATLFRTDPEKARRITVQLGSFMRFNLRLASTSLVELEKECEHLQSYIEIIQTRFFGRLTICFSPIDECKEALIPPSTLQPLVENSVQHGLENVMEGGKIDIEIKRKADSVYIAVRDNGRGFSKKSISLAGRFPIESERGGGTGLYNVNQRLIGMLGEQSRLHIRNLPSGGSEVHFEIPNIHAGRKAT